MPLCPAGLRWLCAACVRSSPWLPGSRRHGRSGRPPENTHIHGETVDAKVVGSVEKVFQIVSDPDLRWFNKFNMFRR